MQYTTNLNLKKPDYTDLADIADVNSNMDTIDASLDKITNNIKVKIGDIKQFIIKPNDNWLRCDGSSKSGDKYPELYSFLGNPIGTPKITSDPISKNYQGTQIVTRVVYFDNKWIAFLGTGDTRISYDGDIWEVGTKTVVPECQGNFFIVNNKIYMCSGTTVAFSSNGIDWKTLDISSSGITGNNTYLSYGNGLWVLTQFNNSYYSTSTDLINWSAKQTVPGVGTTYKLESTCYANGTWYFGTKDIGKVYYTKDFVVWSNATVYSGATIYRLTEVNGYPVAFAYNSSTIPLMLVSVNDGVAWSNQSFALHGFECISYIDGTYYIGTGFGEVYTTTQINSGYTLLYSLGNGTSSSKVRTIGANSNKIIFGGYGANSSTLFKASDYVNEISFVTPNINEYTYIKSKSEVV